MNKYALILTLSLVTFNVYAIPAKLDFSKLPVERDIKRYENKEYATSEEYKQALLEGKCSSVWMWMHLSPEEKVDVIDNLRRIFKEKSNVIIKKPTQYYVKEIDEAIDADPATQYYKLGVIFKTIAVMEYDFDEGIDKEETAKKWLGGSYEVFKESQ